MPVTINSSYDKNTAQVLKYFSLKKKLLLLEALFFLTVNTISCKLACLYQCQCFCLSLFLRLHVNALRFAINCLYFFLLYEFACGAKSFAIAFFLFLSFFFTTAFLDDWQNIIFINTIPTATKLGRVLTYHEGLPALKLLDPLIT